LSTWVGFKYNNGQIYLISVKMENPNSMRAIVKPTKETFQAALNARCAVKAIAGIANLDLNNILSVARAAEATGTHAVDVAAHPEIIEAVRGVTTALIFASAIEPRELALAANAGADAVELGNFDALYEQGLFLSAADVLKRTEEILALLPASGRPLVSVTVPGHLALDSQIQLAVALEALGIDLIQTEGATRILAQEPTVKTLSAEEKAEITLRNTRALAKAVRTPIMSASGINADTVAPAFEAGAAAVGVGAYVNQAADEAEMIHRLNAVLVNRTRLLSRVG
jgi:thiamine monophosphate synthase